MLVYWRDSSQYWEYVPSQWSGLGVISGLIVEEREASVPEAMDGPVISRSSRRIGVPELGLEELATWVVEATCVRDDGFVVAAQREVKAVLRMTSREMLRIKRGQLGDAQCNIRKGPHDCNRR